MLNASLNASDHAHQHLSYESYVQGISESFGLYYLALSICLLCLGMGVCQSCHLGQPKAVRTHI